MRWTRGRKCGLRECADVSTKLAVPLVLPAGRGFGTVLKRELPVDDTPPSVSAIQGLSKPKHLSSFRRSTTVGLSSFAMP
jgi:hypothetical protein